MSSKLKSSISPYSKGFKICLQHGQKNLIMQRFNVGKHTRSELEDKYLNLCDEIYTIKQENNINIDKIKFLRTKLMRIENINRSQCNNSRSSQPITDEDSENISPFMNNNVNKMTNSHEFRNGRCAAGGGRNKKDDPPVQSNSMQSIESSSSNTDLKYDYEKLKDEAKALGSKLETESKKNEQAQAQIRKLEEKISELNLQEKINENFLVIQLKRKIEEKDLKIKNLEKEAHGTDNTVSRKHSEIILDLKGQLRKLNEQHESYKEISEKMDKLNEVNIKLENDIADLETENKALKTQIENLTNLQMQNVDETDNSKMMQLIAANDRIAKELEKLKEYHEILNDGHSQLLSKTKLLQDENDNLVIESEGLKMQKMIIEQKSLSLEKENRLMKAELETGRQKINALDVQLLETNKPTAMSSNSPSASFYINTYNNNKPLKTNKNTQTSADEHNSVEDETPIKKITLFPLSQDAPSTSTEPHVAVENAKNMILSNDKYHKEPETTFDNTISTTSLNVGKHGGYQSDIRIIREEIAEIKRIVSTGENTAKPSFLVRSSRLENIDRMYDINQNESTSTSPAAVAQCPYNKYSEKYCTSPPKKSSRINSVDFNKKSIMQLFDIHATDDGTTSSHIGEITINVLSLKFKPNANVLKNPQIKQVYVEYTFLDYKGHLLETPQSLPKPKSSNDELVFNFRQTFKLNVKTQKRQVALLKDMLKSGSENPLRFFVVSEPSPENDSLECVEIGFAILKLESIVNDTVTDDKLDFTATVFSVLYPHEEIANLHLSIEGIQFIKTLLYFE